MNTSEAEKVLPWVSVEKRDERGRPVTLSVPAHPETVNGKRGVARVARVSLTRDGCAFRCSCQVSGLGDAAEPMPCQGNMRSVCYHCLAAVAAVVSETGGRLYWYEDAEKASRFAHVKSGKVLEIRSASACQLIVFVPGQQPKQEAKATVCKCGAPLPPGAVCEICPCVVKPRAVRLR